MLSTEIKPYEFLVSTYEDFLIWVEKKPDRHRKDARGKMENLMSKLAGEDPIYYLYDLYYNKKKSIREILKDDKIKDIVFFPVATLHRLLFERFGWEARENTERTPVHEQQLDEKVSAEIEKFEAQVAGLIDGREVARVFRMSEFRGKHYRIGKALYILKTLGGIDKKVLFQLVVDGGLSYAILAKSLNKELKYILSRNPELSIDFEEIKLYPQSINRWFKHNEAKIKDVA